MHAYMNESVINLQENTDSSFSLIVDHGPKMILKFCDFNIFFNSMIQDLL